MLTVCWSPKGGSGTSVVAAVLAMQTAASGKDCLLVDLVGDQGAVLAAPMVDVAEGIGDWLAAEADVPYDALRSLEVDVAERLRLLPVGGVGPELWSAERLALVGSLFAETNRAVVIDAGTGRPEWMTAGSSVVVVRSCYLGLRRLVACARSVDSIVFVEEPGRVLSRRDVESALGREVVLLPWDPAVARAVDAGLLVHRLPRSLRVLRPLVAS